MCGRRCCATGYAGYALYSVPVRTLVHVYCREKSFQVILGAQMWLIARFKGIDVADSSVWSMLVCCRSDKRVLHKTQNHVALSIEYRQIHY